MEKELNSGETGITPRYCPTCGTQLTADAKFCARCGRQIFASARAQAQAQQPAQNGEPTDGGQQYAPSGQPQYGSQQYEPTGQPEYQRQYAQQKQSTNGMAIAGFVCAMCGWLFFSIILGPLGIIFGGIGLNKSSTTGNGKGMAIAAIVVGAVETFMWLILVATKAI